MGHNSQPEANALTRWITALQTHVNLQFVRILGGWEWEIYRCVYGEGEYIIIYGGCHTRRGTHANRVEASWTKRRHRANRTTGVHQLNEPFSNCPAIGTVSTITKSPLLSMYIPRGAWTLPLSLYGSPTLRSSLSLSGGPRLCGWPRKVSGRATNLNLIKRRTKDKANSIGYWNKEDIPYRLWG